MFYMLTKVLHVEYIDEYFCQSYYKFQKYICILVNSLINCSHKRLWTDDYKNIIQTYPDIEFNNNPEIKNCVACSFKDTNKTFLKIRFFGKPYDAQTLTQLSHDILLDKIIDKSLMDKEEDDQIALYVCPPCSEMTQMYHQIFHCQYKIYQKCKSQIIVIRDREQYQNKRLTLEQLMELAFDKKGWKEAIISEIRTVWDNALYYSERFVELQSN
ncbi:coiled-coil domain-containing protein 82-like isoform X2 [Gordionus sp. m RMFG-2023]|uniref:coiled-coil domain-containing protein 82-like isoform X2 n=1 Tax=Gordionus sp. m RMFG-2023 TaxID=3053472 RepID=UPI0031FD083D